MNHFNLAPSKENDCYFYVYSTCSKGSTCPFRHEPAALTNETVCTYWKAGKCSRPKCIFRHLDGGDKKRNVIDCYWESQPGGCSKPHCPFLHDKPKDPVTQPLPTASTLDNETMPPGLDSGTIIINKKKLKSLQKMFSVTSVKNSEEGPRRVVVPPGSGGLARQTITGGIKNRLGKGDVKSRLGFKNERNLNDENEETTRIEIVEEEYNSEEERLRRFAIKSLDLRSRIDSRDEKKIQQHASESDSDVDIWIENKKIKKEKKLKKKKDKERVKDGKVKKKSKKRDKEKVRKSRHGSGKKSRKELPLDGIEELEKLKNEAIKSRNFYGDLPSASDYSDLDSPVSSPGAALASVISKTDKAGTLQSDLTVAVSRNSAKQRLGKRERSKSEDREVGQRKIIRKPVSRSNQTYASKVLGGLLGVSKEGVTSRLGTRERERREQRMSEDRSESEERKVVKSEVNVYGVRERLERKRRKSGGITVCVQNKKDKGGKFTATRKVSVSDDESVPEKRVSGRKGFVSEDETITAIKRKMCKSDDEISSKIKVEQSIISTPTLGRKPVKDEQTTVDALKDKEDIKEYAPVGGRKLKLKRAKRREDSLDGEGKVMAAKEQKSFSSQLSMSESFNLDDTGEVNGNFSQDSQDDDVMQQLDDFINE